MNTTSTKNPWSDLKQYTSARIAIGRAGGSLTTTEWLNFKLAHAQARDAVHCNFDCDALVKELQSLSHKVVIVDSRAKNRAEYLQRPDLGRYLDSDSILKLKNEQQPSDIVFIISDGLSATAVHAHAASLLTRLLPRLTSSWSIAPIIIAKFGRVAIEDHIGTLVRAEMAVILLGERPGLSSPDSLGAYLVYHPNKGNTDVNRNCISNIRPNGLDYETAADTLLYLLDQAKQRKLSGVNLKDNRQVFGKDEKLDANNLQNKNSLIKDTGSS